MASTESKIQIFAFSGKMRSGKDYMASLVHKYLMGLSSTLDGGVLILSFSDQLKINVAIDPKNNITYEQVFAAEKDYRTRTLLQETSKVIRRDYGDLFFVNALRMWINLHTSRGVKYIIITDVRFMIELEFLKSMGAKIIRLHAPKRSWDGALRECKGDEEKAREIITHPSETNLDIDPKNFSFIVNNDYDDVNSSSLVLEYITKCCK